MVDLKKLNTPTLKKLKVSGKLKSLDLTDYTVFLDQRLKNKKYAQSYLQTVLEQESPECFLIALNDVMRSQKKKTAKIAKENGLTRQGVNKCLSKDGNPRLSTINAILKSLGYVLSVRELK